MPKTRRLTTNWSKGELSPLLEGHPDLAAYFEGASTIENWLILRQGGVTRWPGSRFVKEVKDSTSDTILWPFEFSVDDAYVLEVGDQYIRVYKNKAPVLNGGTHVEIATPFAVDDLRSIHLTQSADVLFTFHGGYPQRKLSRVSDTNWSLTTQTAIPPPSFEADTDLSATLAIGANTGSGLPFRVGSAVLLAADAGRQIISGASRAIIRTITDASSGTLDVLDAFTQSITAGPATLTSVGTAVASTAHGLIAGDFVRLTSGAQSGELRKVAGVVDPDNVTLDAAFSVNQGVGVTWNKIPATASGAWRLRLSPQTTLDPTIKEPIGAQVTLSAGANAFRAADVGKFIVIYGGVVEITAVDTAASVRGTLLSVMGDTTDANPSAAPAGAWTLEVGSWTVTNGYPRTGDFFQGREYQASTDAEPTTFWGSRSDDFDNYAIGVTAQDAVSHTMASRQVNRIEWLTEGNKALVIGTSGAEFKAIGSGNDNALIGGNTIPLIDKVASNGVAPIQPVHGSRRTLLYIDRGRRKVFSLGFDLESDGDADRELTLGAEHITASPVRLGPLSFQKRPDPRLFFVREDGQLVAMTYFPEQKVAAFARRTTDGAIESCAVIPGVSGTADQIWVIVRREINGQTKRYVEVFDEDHEAVTNRAWTSLQTDAARIVTGVAGTSLSGLQHLEGKDVAVVHNGTFLGEFPVAGGAITLPVECVASDILEVGLLYHSSLLSMEPAIPNEVMDGLPRSWDRVRVRVFKSLGGEINGQALDYPVDHAAARVPYTGLLKVTPVGWDEDGRIRLTQNQPYPMTALSLSGTLSVGEHD